MRHFVQPAGRSFPAGSEGKLDCSFLCCFLSVVSAVVVPVSFVDFVVGVLFFFAGGSFLLFVTTAFALEDCFFMLSFSSLEESRLCFFPADDLAVAVAACAIFFFFVGDSSTLDVTFSTFFFLDCCCCCCRSLAGNAFLTFALPFVVVVVVTVISFGRPGYNMGDFFANDDPGDFFGDGDDDDDGVALPFLGITRTFVLPLDAAAFGPNSFLDGSSLFPSSLCGTFGAYTLALAFVSPLSF